MYYLVYKITNLLDGKFYIGAHKTENKDDGYMGSGILINRAISKYGIENFKKEILVECSSKEEMYQMEKNLVVLCEDSYNLKYGGEGGWEYVNQSGKNKPKTPESLQRHREECIKAGIKCRDEKIGFHAYTEEQRKANATNANRKFYENGGVSSFTYLNNDPEFREKIKRKFKEIDHQKGTKNSQYGTKWIYNDEQKICKKVKKDEEVPEGWKLGRKIKFD